MLGRDSDEIRSRFELVIWPIRLLWSVVPLAMFLIVTDNQKWLFMKFSILKSFWLALSHFSFFAPTEEYTNLFVRCFTWTGGGPDPLSSYALRDIAAGKNLMIVDRVSHADFLAKCIVFMFPHICKHPHIHIYCWPILMVMVMVILMANRRGAQRRLRHLWAPCLACSSLQVCHPLIGCLGMLSLQSLDLQPKLE